MGFGPADRVAIVHADDIGMCHATLQAYEDVADAGLVSSVAVMVPCPWFPAVAAYCRAHPDADVGVHLTLTSEWEHYRWRPISVGDSNGPGLVDDEGFLHRRIPQLEQSASASAVLAEMREQVARARQFGIRVSHVDAHMYALKGRFLPEFAAFALEQQLPALITHDHLRAASLLGDVALRGLPVFDHLATVPDKGDPADRVAAAKAVFDGLPCGLSCFLLHPACDSPELRAIVPNWRYRVADWIAFTDTRLKRHVRDAGIQVIGYHALRNAIW
jgi:hypothetical protein